MPNSKIDGQILASASFYDTKWDHESPRHLSPSDDILARAHAIREALSSLRNAQNAGSKLQILDHGCGMGWLTPLIEEFGLVTGVDLSAAGVKRAAASFPTHHFETLSTFQQRTDVAGRFDVVISQEVIEHVEDQDRYLAECKSYLAPRGALILTTPNKWAVVNMRRTMGLPLDKLGEQPIENILSVSELRRLVKKHFRIQQMYTVFDAYAHRGFHRLLNSVKLRRYIPGWSLLSHLLNARLHTVVIAERPA